MKNHKIVIVDDDRSLLRVMQHHFADAGYNILTGTDGIEGLRILKTEHPALIFTDLKMPHMNGMEFIREVREFDETVVIVVITGFPTIDSAVAAMKAGAFDFIQKPVEKSHLLAVTGKALDYYDLQCENRRLRSLVEDHLDFGAMIGKSPAIQRVYHQARQAASSNATILITGETGTGKEMLAKAIHQNSPRHHGRFIPINCAAVPSTLLESELFGHVKGSFTGAITDRKGLIEEADGGTFFIDEIGDLPIELQPKLLRVLQEKEIQMLGSNSTRKVDVRFIAATHHDLQDLVKNNTFREDLYFRLNVIPLQLPPIRDRQEDILPLFNHFLKEAAEDEHKPVPLIEKPVQVKLQAHGWNGNVREIQNVARRLMALHVGDHIGDVDLPDSFSASAFGATPFAALPAGGIDLEEWTDNLIVRALEKNGWNQSRTAKYLNISRNTLVYRMEKRPILRTAKGEHPEIRSVS